MDTVDQRQPEEVVITHTLMQVNAEQEFYILYAAGQACICPFQPVVPQQDERGHAIVARGSCNTACPLARVEIREDRGNPQDSPPFKKEHFFVISCGGVPLERRVEIQRATRLVKGPGILRAAN